jgi:hypothetical protein
LSISLKKAKKAKKLLILRQLHFLREPALEVLLDLAVISPKVLVHRWEDFYPGHVEVTAGSDCGPLPGGQMFWASREFFPFTLKKSIPSL